MALDSLHPEYTRWSPVWKRCRDIHDGSDAVKARGVTYLPMPGGMDDLAYAAYKTRAQVYGAFQRTVEGFLGYLFRSPPSVTAPEPVTDQLDDVTLLGQHLDRLRHGPTQRIAHDRTRHAHARRAGRRNQ